MLRCKSCLMDKPMDACNGKPQAHHPDYSHPLDVVCLCDKHHKEAHAIERAERRKAA